MLVPWLLARGHKVTVYDTFWFGKGCLPEDNANLTIIRGDVRPPNRFWHACLDQDAVIYLASISSDKMCQKNEALAAAVNHKSFSKAVYVARQAGVKRFIYASSVAAYGSTEGDAKEDMALQPSTIYGRGKAACEAILRDYEAPDFTTVVTRSASVCGYSPHQRLDLTVNMMVHDAVRKRVVTVNGGRQKRSHIHMLDLCHAYGMLLTAPAEKVAGQAFNLVAENQEVLETAELVAATVNCVIDIKPRTDNRSYTVSGEKAERVLGFKPTRSVEQAIEDLKALFDDGYWKDSETNPLYMNVVNGLV